MNQSSRNDLPTSFGILLAENTSALNYFASLPLEQQKQIMDQTHDIKSKDEMKTFINSLGQNTTT